MLIKYTEFNSSNDDYSMKAQRYKYYLNVF